MTLEQHHWLLLSCCLLCVFFVNLSVCQGQTPGREWTLLCPSSLPALPCLTWQRENPTASACVAATPQVWVSLLCPQEKSLSQINWVSQIYQCSCCIQISSPWLCYYYSFLSSYLLATCFPNRSALCSRQPGGYQEHWHLSGCLLGGL